MKVVADTWQRQVTHVEGHLFSCPAQELIRLHLCGSLDEQGREGSWKSPLVSSLPISRLADLKQEDRSVRLVAGVWLIELKLTWTHSAGVRFKLQLDMNEASRCGALFT